MSAIQRSWFLARVAAVAALTLITVHWAADSASAPSRARLLSVAATRSVAHPLGNSGGAALLGGSADQAIRSFDGGVIDDMRCIMSARQEYIQTCQDKTTNQPTVGVLYGVRRAVEHFVTFLLFPLVAFAILHGVVTNRNAPDKALSEVALKVVTVVLMLFLYPAWDVLVFDQAAVPMVKAILKGGLAQQAMESATGDKVPDDADVAAIAATTLKGHTQLAEMVRGACPNLKTPQEKQMLFAELAQNVGSETKALLLAKHVNDKMDATASGVRACHDLTEGVGLYFADPTKWKDLMAGGTSAGSHAFQDGLRVIDSTAKVVIDRMVDASLSQEEAEKQADAESESEGWSIAGWLASKATGIVMLLANLLATAAIWVTWIYVILIKNLSLTFAPVAFARDLVPGSSGKTQAWFIGHTKFVMRPVALALAVLLFTTITQATMYGPHNLGWLGLGFKLGMLILFIAACVKGTVMTDMLAGDVAKAVGEMAASVKSVAMTAAVGATGIGMGVVGAAANGVRGDTAGARGRVMGRLANLKDRFDQTGVGKVVKSGTEKVSQVRKEVALGDHVKAAWGARQLQGQGALGLAKTAFAQGRAVAATGAGDRKRRYEEGFESVSKPRTAEELKAAKAIGQDLEAKALSGDKTAEALVAAVVAAAKKKYGDDPRLTKMVDGAKVDDVEGAFAAMSRSRGEIEGLSGAQRQVLATMFARQDVAVRNGIQPGSVHDAVLNRIPADQLAALKKPDGTTETDAERNERIEKLLAYNLRLVAAAHGTMSEDGKLERNGRPIAPEDIIASAKNASSDPTDDALYTTAGLARDLPHLEVALQFIDRAHDVERQQYEGYVKTKGGKTYGAQLDALALNFGQVRVEAEDGSIFDQLRKAQEHRAQSMEGLAGAGPSPVLNDEQLLKKAVGEALRTLKPELDQIAEKYKGRPDVEKAMVNNRVNEYLFLAPPEKK